jgi:hypothetical protein
MSRLAPLSSIIPALSIRYPPKSLQNKGKHLFLSNYPIMGTLAQNPGLKFLKTSADLAKIFHRKGLLW